MNKDYKELVRRVKERTNPDSYQQSRMYSENITISKAFESATINFPDVVEYIRLSMRGVSKQYTSNTKLAARKVKDHLIKSHGDKVDFKGQGSIMTNTHILKDHDIDLIQLTNQSNSIDHIGLKNAIANPSNYNNVEYQNLKKHFDDYNKYSGDQLSDLRQLRNDTEKILTDTYKTVDVNKPKSVYVETTNPKRSVDVVIAVYHKDLPFMKSNHKFKKGIQIYDKKSDSKLPTDYPFLSIKRINEKSLTTGKRLKNIIRFLKNVKFDSSLINDDCYLKSFHINAICYDIDIDSYRYKHFLELANILKQQLGKILNDSHYADNLKSVDGEENIFEKDKKEKLKEIQSLYSEIDSIISDLSINDRIAV